MLKRCSMVVWPALLAGILSGLSGCPKKGGVDVAAARESAGPWRSAYVDFFDDQFDFKPLVAVDSDEPFARKAMDRLERRIALSDVIVVAKVVNVGEMANQQGDIRRGLVVEVSRLLKGTKSKLPDPEQISLYMAQDQPEFSPQDVMGNEVLLFLRWLPAKASDPYHWHLNLSNPQLLGVVEGALARAKGKPASR